MTRKDYVMLAEAIKGAGGFNLAAPVEVRSLIREGHRQVAILIADALEEDNPRFDRDRFIKACGVEDG